MKTWKHGSFWAVLVIFAIAFTLTACEPEESDEPKDQNTRISGLFGAATVRGYISDAQVTKVKNALNAGYAYMPSVQDSIKTYFQNNAVIIVVQTTTEYTIYKTDSNEPGVIYFNVAALDGALTAEYAYKAMSDRLNNVDWKA
jgi:hypothetical protein